MMGWSIGYNSEWKRDIGYGVPAWCDHPQCTTEIDRGLSYVCGGEPPCSDGTCQLFFCESHQRYQPRKERHVCARCVRGATPFKPKPDHWKWVVWKLNHPSWQDWRSKHTRDLLALVDLFEQYQKGTAVPGVAPVSRAKMMREYMRNAHDIDPTTL
jgi:hypothetical protein